MMAEKISFRDEVAQEIIKRIEEGTAPWQKPWDAGATGVAPFNPTSGKAYRGINDLWLSMRGYTDPRWMTYRQAEAAEAQVRKGEKATGIEYWQWSVSESLKDENGNPVLDGDGKQRYQTYRLERPRVFYAKVFNAEQIDGMAPWIAPAPAFNPLERAEAIVAGAGVPVLHDQHDRAFYRPMSDEIHLPPRAAFKGAAEYYETALHELGHATGHQSRLNRFFGPFGSEGYAREELRAEIASYMLARDMGISFDPANHAAYVESWLKVLREDKNEIFHAARDAETIKTWVMEPEQRQVLDQAAQQKAAGKERAASKAEEPAMSETEKPKIRTYIAVPFAEKDEAKGLGAKWDRKAKSWYMPEGVDSAGFAKWTGKTPEPAPAVSPVAEFADFLKSNGLLLAGEPVMDGKWQRVAVEGDKGKSQSGSYRGFLDGRPSGQATNYKAGIQAAKWVATGVALTDEERANIQAEAAEVRARREAERLEAAQKAAKVAFGVWENLPGEATAENCPYLKAKGVQGHGVKVDADGHLVVPARDAGGRLWGVQVFHEEGKRFIKDAHKVGTMHVIAPVGSKLADLGGDWRPIVICEGYATGATIYEATKYPTVVAFDAGNLKPVAEAVRAAYPDRDLVIAADNDHANVNGNVGIRKAEEAAQAVKAVIAVPPLDAQEKAQGLTDFNDLGESRNKLWVRSAIDEALGQTRRQAADLGRGVA
jgi:antirestriction protein ArdC/phage/plasmid primase-like uncharacterized protein